MKRKVVDVRLPGRYGKMTAEELDAEVARFDREIPQSQMKPLTRAQREVLKRARRKGGRPRIGQGARGVLITAERGLLNRADLYARTKGLSRSKLIARGLKSILGSVA